jgi:integrase/recombinase XerD
LAIHYWTRTWTLSARARPNTLIATAYDLQVFFAVIGKDPIAVTPRDVLVFITAQRAPRRGPRVVRLEDRESGLSARTIKRRLASISGFYEYFDLPIADRPLPRFLDDPAATKVARAGRAEPDPFARLVVELLA